MTSTWDMAGGPPPRRRRLRDTDEADASKVRPKRLRSGDEAVSPGASRKDQAQARVLRLVDEQVLEQRAMESQQTAAAWRLGAITIDADGLFAFAMFVPLLFMANLGSLGAAAFAAMVPAYVFFRRERLLQVMWPRLFLFLVPALALFSVVWSEAPGETFKLSIEFGLTVMAGLLISSARNQAAVLKGLAAAFFLYVAVSALYGGSVRIGVGMGGYAFSGLTGSKNLLADIASTGLIISFAVMLIAIRRRDPIWFALAGAGMLLDVYVVLAARSAGALLGLGMGAAAMLSLAPLLAVSRVVRAWLTSAVALILLAAGLSYRWLAETMITVGAQVFDKDPTLTGRTYLWWRAEDLIVEKPLLGRGYYAFWVQGNLDAEGLWRYFGIDERAGFTFHNTAVELLVTLGWVGLILTAAVVLIAAIFLVKRFVERPSIALVCWISIFLYQLARTPIETIGVAPFYFSTALAFAALGAAFGRVRAPSRAARAPYHQPQVIQLRPVSYTDAGWATARPAPARGSLRLLRPTDSSEP